MIKDIEKTMPQALKKEWLPVLKVCQNGQVELQSVVRWVPYLHDPVAGQVREQNLLQHMYAVNKLVNVFEARIGRFDTLDWSFIKSAITAHDEGRGHIGHDVRYKKLNHKEARKEYDAFLDLHKGFKDPELLMFKRAFLLQFALQNPRTFKKKDQEIMCSLAAEKKKEALVLDAIIRWSHVLFAFEQYTTSYNQKILVQVLRNQVPELNRIAGERPNHYFNEIWPAEIRQYFTKFMKGLEGEWIEPDNGQKELAKAAV